MGWRKVRWKEPRALIAIGSLLGIPLAVLIGFFWSRMPLTPLTFSIDAIGLGSWSAFLLPLIIIVVIAAFLIVLVVAHEFIHLLAFPNFGLTSATVFGVWPSRLLPYAYHSGPVSCRRMIAVALAPFIVLSVAPLIASYIGLLRLPLGAMFHAQARLLRLVPLWYCAPLGVGGILFVAPKAVEEFVPFLMVAGMFVVVFAVAIWVNRRAAVCIEESAKLLTD